MKQCTFNILYSMTVGQMIVSQMIVSQMIVSQMTVGQMTVGQMNVCPPKNTKILKGLSKNFTSYFFFF